jgi:hypothetical protein
VASQRAVEGEISNCRQWSSGPDFTLKDDYADSREMFDERRRSVPA